MFDIQSAELDKSTFWHCQFPAIHVVSSTYFVLLVGVTPL